MMKLKLTLYTAYALSFVVFALGGEWLTVIWITNSWLWTTMFYGLPNHIRNEIIRNNPTAAACEIAKRS